MLTVLRRQFRVQPLYALTCVGILALAVAAAATSFAVVKRAFLDPLPYADGERLVSVVTGIDDRQGGMSVFVLEDLRKGSQAVLRDFAPFRYSSPTHETNDAAEGVQALDVTDAYFQTMGVLPAMGTVWSSGDASAAIVSWSFWQRALSGDPNAIGRSITLDGVRRQVVGVMPSDFIAPFGPDTAVWLPLDMRPLLADTARARRMLTVFARLAPGVTLEQANAYMDTFSKGQRSQYPAIHARERWFVKPLREDLIGSSETALMGTGAAAALLMLIVWANIAGLSAARASAERQHYAIRTALGATAGRLFRERLADSLVVSIVGSAAGLWLAYALIAFVARYQQQFLPLLAPVSFERLTAAIGLFLGMATGVFAALAPHGAIMRLQTEDPLRNARSTTGGMRLTAVRSGLVLVQVAVAVVLVVAAGLLVRTVSHLSATSLGFDTGNLTYFHVTLPLPRYRQTETQVRFERDVLEQLGRLPGVSNASASVGFPTMGSMGARLTILDRPQQAPAEIAYYSVTPRFFSFLDVPITEGRDIAESDDFPAPRVVVINQTMAKMFWPEGNAIGAKVKIGAGAATDREITIVGIAGDVRQGGPTQDVRPTAYGSTLQYSWPRRHFAVKTDGRLASLATEMRAAVRTVDPSVATTTATAINDVVSQQTARHRLVMVTLTFFGVVAIVLCGAGLYAVVALTSQFRRREYAIRVALGSSRQHVRWMVVRQSLMLASIGAVLGLALAAAGTRTLQGLLHGVTPMDQATFIVALGSVLLLAAVSASLPAWKAGRVDPIEALKTD